MSAQITPQHQEKPAYVYVRQSTLAQVRHHQESTERQYALREKALTLGWPASSIRVLDGDLGLSGAQSAAREDFKTLVAEVSMGQVGAVVALDVSRLARSNADWHRLLELCALTHTLVIDEDGCYDPADFNDGLLLGLKGTMAQAELHWLRGRLQGGQLNKAQKGELRRPLPVGLCYDDDGRIVLDPDEEVRGAVALVFQLFEETGSAYGVMQRYAAHGLRFPKRAYGGAWAGQLLWGQLTHARVLGLLKNPAYAGAYVFGRYQYRREIRAQGEVCQQLRPVPMAEWRVHLPAHHEGYITWEQFLQHQARLATNRTNAAAPVLNGAAREGLALLQGLLLCRTCGHAVTTRYTGNGGLYPQYTCTWPRRHGLATHDCLSVRCDRLDAAVAAEALRALEPAQLALAVAAVDELETRDRALLRQWQMRQERAQYEAALAERRYEEADPSNRLVAATLEQRWNARLTQLEEATQDYQAAQRQQARIPTPEEKQHVLALATDLPRVWQAPSTEPKDRKRLLRLLIKDITVEKQAEPKQAVLHLRWQGGACSELTVPLPPRRCDQVRCPEPIVARVRELAVGLTDEDIARRLNAEGHRSPTQKPYTTSMVRWIRWKHQIAAPDLKHPHERTVHDVATRFGVSIHTVHYWIQRGRLPARQLRPGGPYWITLTAAKVRELRAVVKSSRRLQANANHS